MATILVIDDEEIIRSLAEKILSRDSHTILTEANSAGAISSFREHSESIDIVLVDMILDDLNGFDILTEIRKTTPEIPGIISSGNSYNERDIPKILNNNIYFLQKPYRATELSELVNSILSLV